MGVLLEKTKRYFINRIPINTKVLVPENRIPFFIIGSGRNGSTLLSAILNNHTDVFIPPEQYALPNCMLKWQYNWFPNKEKKLLDLLQLFLSRCYHWKIDVNEAQQVLVDQQGQINSFYDFMYELYNLEAKCNHKKTYLYGDKTPYNTFYTPLLSRYFSNSKFIFLQRDPRDFAASMRKMKPAVSLENIIYRWEYSSKGLSYIQRKNRAVLVCKYKDLVTNPVLVIKQVLEFLNVKAQDDILQHYQRHLFTLGVSNTAQHSNINNPINTQSIGKYKNVLSAKEINIIERKFYLYFKEQ